MRTETCTLGDIGKVCMCKRVLKEQTSPSEEIPFYKISTFGGKADTFISRKLYNEYKTKYSYPKKGDVLISAAGTIGKTVIYNGEDAFFQDSNIVWIDNDESMVLNDYLYYYYKTNPWKVTSGSTIQRLYNDNISGAVITFPKSIDVQKQLISVLKILDEKIKNNDAISAQLESLAKTIYDYWFLQFEFPNEDGKPYKSSGGKMMYNEELKKEIPEGWKVKAIGDTDIYVSDYTANGSFQGLADNVRYNEGNKYALLIRIVDFNNNFERPNDFIFVNKHAYEYLAKSELHGDEIIICNVGAVGNVYRCPEFNIPMTLGPNGIVVKHNSWENYLYMHFRSSVGQAQLHGISSGSIQMKFNKTNFRELPLLIPIDNVLQHFNNWYIPIYAEIKRLWKENRQLSSLRDFLLPLLMNGQVTFTDAEKMVNDMPMAAEDRASYTPKGGA